MTFGGNVFGWTADQATSFSLLDALVDNQLNFIDTADVYSSWAPGNRGRIGNRHRRMAQEERQARPVIIATKVGKTDGRRQTGAVAALYSAGGGRPLRRLQTDYIDLYQSHDDDRDTPLEETLAAFDALIKAGKVRAIGASNYQADRPKQRCG